MSTHQYGDGPIAPEYREKMIAVIKTVDEFVNDNKRGKDREIGIVVLMFPFGDGPGRCNFMSNGVARQDLVALMKEMIARFETDASTT